jgi:hypothetical protein
MLRHITIPLRTCGEQPLSRLSWIAALALLPLSLVGMGSRAQAAGLTTAFNPNEWVLVNTAITGENPVPNNVYLCNTPSIDRVDACVDSADGNGFVLYGSSVDTEPSPLGNNDTIFSIKNTNSNLYVVTFNWTLPPTPGASSTITLSINNNGIIYSLNQQGSTIMGTPSGDCPTGNFCTAQSATAYVPAGATLSFKVSSDSSAGAPTLTIDNFNATEVPAPLPIAGSSAVLLYSRRLRRRTLTAASQPPALHPSTGKVLSLAEQRASLQRQLALKHYGTILGGPVQPVLPISRSTNQS